MNNDFPLVPLRNCIVPIERSEVPIAGKIYRQIGVRLWGEGAYERESIDGSQTKYSTLSQVEADDIIVNKIWARNGSVAVVPQYLAGSFGSGEFPTFTPIREKINPRWFHWFTKTRGFWNQCDEKSRGTSGKNRIRPEKFLEILIPLPQLEKQRRIVARIEELAARIEEARGLRREAVKEVKMLPNSQLETIFNNFAKRYVSLLLEELLLEAGYGTSTKCSSDRTNDSLPVLRIPNIASERVNFDDMKYGILENNELKRVLLTEGDILVVRTNGSADLVGRCAVVPAFSVPTAFASYMIRLRCDSNVILPEYLQLMLRHLRTNGQLIDFARTTAGQYNVSLGRLRAARIPVPPIPEQWRIITYLGGIQSRADYLQQLQSETSAELNALLPSILNKAFKGEL